MAIAALIAIIVLLAKNWDKVTAAVKTHANKILGVLSIFYFPLTMIISMIREIASNWGRIKEALAATGLFDKIKEIGEGIKTFFGSIGEKIVGIWNTAKEKIGSIFSGIAGAVMDKIGPVINWIKNAWHTATTVIGGVFKGIFDAVYNFVKPALDWFSEKWQEITALFKDNAIVNAIKVIGGTLLSGLLAPVQGLLEILSYIPGLGHLAGKGTEKIEELRNFLKGVDGATVSADVNVPESVKAELTPPTDTGAPSPYDIPGFGIPGSPDFGPATGAGGRSKLHGVVDISGGAIPTLNDDGTYTATGAVNASAASTGESIITRTAIEIAAILRRIDAGVSLISRSLPVAARAGFPSAAAPEITYASSSVVNNYAAAASTGESLITRTAIEIAAILRRIDAGVSFISHSLPVPARTELPSIAAPETATRASPITPRVRMGGDEGANDYHNPRNVPPITQAERIAYSFSERRETIVIEVAAEKGTAARVVRAPRDADIRLVTSGGNA
jgi:hypothetical protein